jgi:DNA repair exonuclease SbcCD ATPase subunit
VFTEVALNRSPTTLIVGENGSGKSTVLDALCFGLFGRAFRQIPRPLLVNSINQKGLVVEVEFNVGNNEYKIIRGQKKYGSNTFEIFKNGTLINQEANNRDYQKYLEDNILKLNHSSFTQIVVLGSSSFIPFMQLKTAERREIIEDILDIKIFSFMNILLKEKQTGNKDLVKNLNYDMELQEQKIESQERHVSTIKQGEEQQLELLREQIGDAEKKANYHTENVEESVRLIDNLIGQVEDKDSIEARFRKTQQLEDQLENKTRVLKKELKFYESNDTCPTCKQPMDNNHKQHNIKEKGAKLIEIEDGLEKIGKVFEETNARLVEINDIQTKIQELQTSVNTENAAHSTLRQYVKDVENQIKTLESNTSNIGKENKKLLTLTEKLAKLKEKSEEYSNEASLFEAAGVLLKDKGIKQRIIRQYVPIINKLVNKYLAAMDFFVEFELDEKFNETIKSRHRDNFTYDSFSEGEKMRIDLALLFTWRSIAKMKNSTNTNLLILDEVFDASLDAGGCDEFLKLIHELGIGSNVFVISHKGDILQDKFFSSIKFEKHKNFSRMAAA